VLPCLSDPWKLQIIAHLNIGRREVNFFASGKVTIREVNDIDEGKKLVNSILAMVAQKQLLKEQLK